MQRMGAAHVPDDVLLAVILRSGVPNFNVTELARGLLRDYGSLTRLAESTVEELAALKGMGPVKAQVLSAALELGRRLHQESTPPRTRIRTPEDVRRLLSSETRTLSAEVFWVLHLDAKNYLKGPCRDVSRGLLDASLVHPREVFRDAIRSAAAAVIVAHNHPSGDPTPSAEDIRITRQLIAAGKIIDIKVLDHIILGADGEGGGGCVSLREAGLASFD